MRVIGTAGHVDHGKSTLVAALTGLHPDRLKEEQEREMTIDLGFGWFSLPDGKQVGVVDVPGHRDFIENMLAGVGGIDAALLVVAADEGVMPQTREHLSILDLLQVPAGILVLNKIDLAPDPAWLDLVEKDIRTIALGTPLQDAPCVRISARTGQGLDQLLQAVAEILKAKPARVDLGRPRLPIDRVFSLPGFGTIVTGTLLDGSLNVGDEIEVLPTGLTGRVRGLQTHNQKENSAPPGARTAVNLSGIDTNQVHRGEVLAHNDRYQVTRRMDAHFRLLKDCTIPVKHGTEVKFFAGTSESMAVLRLLGVEELRPGEAGWIQLELSQPLVAIRGDHFILRRPSPGETLGGGTILDNNPKGRHKRFDDVVIDSLTALAKGSPSDILLEASLALGIAPLSKIIERARLDGDMASLAVKDLIRDGQLVFLDSDPSSIQDHAMVIAKPRWLDYQQQVMQIVHSYHGSYPLRRGIPREELRSRLKLEGPLFNAIMNSFSIAGEFIDKGGTVALIGHEIRYTADQHKKIQSLLQKFEQHPYNPPSVKDCQAEVGDELLQALLDSEQLVRASPEVIFRKIDHDTMVARIRQVIQERGRITLAEVRDLFETSRKYAQAVLEKLDDTGVTIRDGDIRRLK